MCARVIPHHVSGVHRVLGLAGLFVFGLALAGCSKLGFGQDEMTWARTALERNDRIEVVGVDQQTNSFMIRLKDSGEIRMVRLDQVIAGPPGVLGDGGRGRPVQAAMSDGMSAGMAQGSQLQGQPGTAAPGGMSTGAGSADLSAGAADADVAAPAAAPVVRLSPTQGANTATGTDATVAAGPSGRVVPGAAVGAAAGRMVLGAAGGATVGSAIVASAAPSGGSGIPPGTGSGAGALGSAMGTSGSAPGANVPGGRVLAAGPGYTITAASSRASAGRSRASSETTVTPASLERRHEPIICQGSQLMQIDNRNLEFDGDAVAAEDGCELHITNSRIIARGTGVLARAANVHIENSQIEGDLASIEVAQGGQVYAHSSKFRGLSRRLDTASVEDLGGNVWN